MNTFSTISYAFRQNLRNAGYDVPLGPCQQIISAALGFKSLAAYQASNLSSGGLHRVGHLVIDKVFLLSRVNGLSSFSEATPSLKELIAALRSAELGAAIHSSIDDFQGVLQQELEHFIQQDSDVISAMSSANSDGIDEFYLPFDLEKELADSGSEISIDAQGHVGLNADIERPFSGNKVNVDATITLERLTPTTFSNAVYFVEKADLDYGWTSDDDEDHEPPSIPLAQALADALEISVEEAEELVDVDPQAITSHEDSLIDYYILDFENVAIEPLRSKLLETLGSLQIEVDRNFFDNVQADIY